MPVQTTKTTYVYFPDGAVVSVKASGDGSYTDLGAINSAVNATLNYDENQVETANAGKLAKQISNMTIAGGFTLINLNPSSVAKLSGGALTVTTTTSSPSTTISDQTISSGDWAENTPYDLSMLESGVAVKASTSPTLTSVTGSVDGALTVNDDYFLIPSSNSVSGYQIMFNVTTGSNLTTAVQDIVVDYASVTPVSRTTVNGGSSTVTLAAYAMKITHTDSASKIRELELYAVDTDSGGFQFNFKGANEDGVEEMPLTYTGRLDTSLTDGQQLFAWRTDTGAA